jgi:hypothetical protein
MHANNDSPWRPIYLPFCGADRREGLFGVRQSPNRLSSSGRIVIVGPVHRKCPGVVVVAVDKKASAVSATRRRPDVVAVGRRYEWASVAALKTCCCLHKPGHRNTPRLLSVPSRKHNDPARYSQFAASVIFAPPSQTAARSGPRKRFTEQRRCVASFWLC